MVPSKRSAALVRISLLPPSVTLPVPSSVRIVASPLWGAMSKVPWAVTPLEVARLPSPARPSAASCAITVRPVKVLAPASCWVPPVTETPPVPAIVPSKRSAALVRISLLPPSVTLPVPSSVRIVASPLWGAMSKVPWAVTPLEVARLPSPARPSAASCAITVRPVKVLAPASCWVPPVTLTPPVPAMVPSKRSAALVRISLLPPSVTLPVPATDCSRTSPLWPAVFSAPSITTFRELAMLPLPSSFSVPPSTVVFPVKVCAVVKVRSPAPDLVTAPSPEIVPA